MERFFTAVQKNRDHLMASRILSENRHQTLEELWNLVSPLPYTPGENFSEEVLMELIQYLFL